MTKTTAEKQHSLLPVGTGAPSADPASLDAPAAKKRKRPTTTTATTTTGATKKCKTAAAVASKKKARPAAVVSSSSSAVAAPLHILIVDNGGDTLKYGWHNTSSAPSHLPNVTARLQQQWTVLCGDELFQQIQNPAQALVGVTRSTERGMITNLGNQVQVWKRMLDLLQVAVPMHTETAATFGWTTKMNADKKKKKHKTSTASTASTASATTITGSNNSTTSLISPASCAILLALPPHCPRTILDQIAAVWLDDFGFANIGFCCAPVVCATAAIVAKNSRDQQQHSYQTAVVVDLGWSATHIVPTFQGKPILHGDADDDDDVVTIKRVPLAGRHLINMYKYYTSYRQWNMMDQEILLRDVLHKTAFVSLQFQQDMDSARRLPGGKRPYDCEFVLPDYTTTFEGQVRLPVALQREQDEQEEENEKQRQQELEDQEDEEDEDYHEKEMAEKEEENEEGNDDNDDEADSDNDDDDEDEEESQQDIRRRILKERAQEERRQRQLEEQQQVLNLSTERFCIPEVLFCPSDAMLPAYMASLPAAIVQSISACPKSLQPALYQSIFLVGGLSQLPGLQERLKRELRALAPCEMEVEFLSCTTSSDGNNDSSASSSPMNQAWLGACKLSKEEDYQKWSITKKEWEESKKTNLNTKRGGYWNRLHVTQGGHLV